jgi:CAAX protease family protein
MTQFPPPSSAPAGWYADPEGRPGSRYFDGTQWAPPTVYVPAFAPAAEPHPSLPPVAAVGALAILLASLVSGRMLVDVVVRFDLPIVVYVAFFTAIAYGPVLAWCFYVSRRWGSSRLSADVGLRFRWSDTGWGPVVWGAMLVTSAALVALIEAFNIPFSSNLEGGSDVDVNRTYLITVAISLVVAAPLVEEIVFRGVVMRGLLGRLGAIPTIALQAVFFGAAHFDPVFGAGNIGLVLALSGGGAALGLAAYLLRRIGPTIVAHAIWNSVAFIVLLSRIDEFDF